MLTPRHARRTLAAAAAVTLVAAWAITLGPHFLGGPAEYVIVSGNSMDPTLSDGDLVIARRQSAYKVGDIVAYRVPKDELGAGVTIIHRLVGGSPSAGYRVQGDNNPGQDPWKPRQGDVVGKLFIHVPRLGRLLVFFRTTLGLALLAGIAAAIWTMGSPHKPATALPSRRRAARRARPPVVTLLGARLASAIHALKPLRRRRDPIAVPLVAVHAPEAAEPRTPADAAPAPAPAPAVVAQPPLTVRIAELASQPGATGDWNLYSLSRLVTLRGSAHPERLHEWKSYLFFLREHADTTGRLPGHFDGLVRDVFAELLAATPLAA